MRRNQSSLRTQLKRIGLALVLGVVLCLLSTALLLTYLKSSSWVSSGPTPNPESFQATYLDPIAPELVEVRHHSPSIGNGSFPLSGINLGADMVSYSYGISLWDKGYTPWDPTVDAEPTSVNIMRYRFGWPMRMLSYDDISTGASIAIPSVASYHQRAYQLAGNHRGLDRPGWVPGFIPLYRVPTMIRWDGVVINTLAWACVGYALLSTVPLIRAGIAHRRMQRGVCVVCQYQLDDLQQCPECGTHRA
ncbi:MAG: hypothetical protein ACF8MF_01755 [Phycisphaerales bacterium JB052]